MKIAVTSTGPTLDDTVEARFGRCPYFLIIDPDTLEFEAIENPNISLGGGAGIQSAQLMASKNVSVVLTGNCGPNAFQTFEAAGVKLITGVSGQIRQAVEQYKSNALSSTTASNVQSHFGMGTGGDMEPGMGGGIGRGMGMGGGRGMGGGGGMGRGGGSGMGRGMGRGMSGSTSIGSGQPAPPSTLTKEDELKSLKDQVSGLSRQIEAIEASMKALGHAQK